MADSDSESNVSTASGYRSTITPASLAAIPIFTPGTEDAIDWLNTIDRLGRVFGWDGHMKLDIAKCRLSCKARTWERGLDLKTWKAFRGALLDRFGISNCALHAQLSYCHQHDDQSVRSYSDRFLHLLYRLNIIPGTMQMYGFLRGLHPWIYSQVYLMQPVDLHEAIDCAVYVEDLGWQQEAFEQRTPTHMQTNSHAYRVEAKKKELNTLIADFKDNSGNDITRLNAKLDELRHGVETLAAEMGVHLSDQCLHDCDYTNADEEYEEYQTSEHVENEAASLRDPLQSDIPRSPPSWVYDSPNPCYDPAVAALPFHAGDASVSPSAQDTCLVTNEGEAMNGSYTHMVDPGEDVVWGQLEARLPSAQGANGTAVPWMHDDRSPPPLDKGTNKQEDCGVEDGFDTISCYLHDIPVMKAAPPFPRHIQLVSAINDPPASHTNTATMLSLTLMPGGWLAIMMHGSASPHSAVLSEAPKSKHSITNCFECMPPVGPTGPGPPPTCQTPYAPTRRALRRLGRSCRKEWVLNNGWARNIIGLVSGEICAMPETCAKKLKTQ